MAFYEVSSDLIQKIGDDLYRINLSTTANQVFLKKADGTTVSLKKEIEDLAKAIEDMGGTVSGASVVYVKDDIAGRDALTDLTVGSICYVTDASADSTVDSGAASYIWDGTTWKKLTEFESLDVILDWANIQNKPDWLDKVDVDANGNLTVDGNKVGVDNGGTFSIKVTGDNPDYAAEIAKLGETPNNSLFVAMREEPTEVTQSTKRAVKSKSFSLR